ncbi:TPA: hypothetical protein KNK83_003680 [Clostridioides difficile]|nr:hypothetical protein [Clostridioides difficile]
MNIIRYIANGIRYIVKYIWNMIKNLYPNGVIKLEDNRVEKIKEEFKLIEDGLNSINTNEENILQLKIIRLKYELKIMSRENTLSANIFDSIISKILTIGTVVVGTMQINKKLENIFENKSIETVFDITSCTIVVLFLIYLVIKTISLSICTYYTNSIEEYKIILKLVDLKIEELKDGNNTNLSNL